VVLANAEHVKAGLVSELCGCQDLSVTLDGGDRATGVRIWRNVAEGVDASIVLTAVFVLVVSVRGFAFRPTSFDSASFINSPTTEALPNREIERWH